MRTQSLRTHFSRALPTSYVFFARIMSSWRKQIAFRLDNLWKEYKVFIHNLWKKCLCQSWIFYCWGEGRLIGVGSKQKRYCLPCVGAAVGAGKTNSAAKTVTLPMTLNQPLWKMNLWTRSVPITSNCEPAVVSWLVKAIQARMTTAMTLNIFTIHWFKQQINKHTGARNPLFNTEPVSSFDVAALSSAVFL